MYANMILKVIFITVVVVAAAADEVIKMDFDPSVFSRSPRADSVIAACPATSGSAVCDPTCRKAGFCLGSEFRETDDCGEKYCDVVDGEAKCTMTLGKCVPNKPDIGCDTDGEFPDLYDCRNSITCTKGQIGVSKAVCEDDLGYDVCTGQCDVVLAKKACEPVRPLCMKTGLLTKMQVNNRLYYYCVKDHDDGLLHPVIGRCSRGYFDETTGSCKDSQIPGCLDSSQTPSTTNTVLKTSEYTDGSSWY